MSELERVLGLSNSDVSEYLGDVSVDDFREDIRILIVKYSDKGAIELAISELQKLL